MKNSLPELRYSPPSYHSYGLPPTQLDPFEMNTVEVNFAETSFMSIKVKLRKPSPALHLPITCPSPAL